MMNLPNLPHLANPGWLLLLLALPALAFRHHAAGRRGALGALTYSRLPAAAVRRGGGLRLHLPFYARLLAFFCLVVALARPQLGYAWEESLTEGIDIVICLDISGSMGAEDFQPKDRLTVAKQVVKEFVDNRPGDRIGIVVFSGGAMVRAPLTTDRQMLGQLIDAVELNSLPDGTAIGVAMANAAAPLEGQPGEEQGHAPGDRRRPTTPARSIRSPPPLSPRGSASRSTPWGSARRAGCRCRSTCPTRSPASARSAGS